MNSTFMLLCAFVTAYALGAVHSYCYTSEKRYCKACGEVYEKATAENDKLAG